MLCCLLSSPDFHLSCQNINICLSIAISAYPSVKPHIFLFFFSYPHVIIYTSHHSCVKSTGFIPRHQSSNTLGRLISWKESYLSIKFRSRFNISMALPTSPEKQLGLYFQVKRNSDYADHFTTHGWVIDSQSIGCNLHTSSLIRGS